MTFLTKKKNFMLYCGNPGIGKTYLCAALMGWANENFSSWRYWNEAELLKRVRSSMEEFKGDYHDSLKFLIDDDLIFFDDLGSMGVNEWRKEVMFSAIDIRYNNEKPTIITSNFNSQDILNKYSSRMHSRLFSKENVIIELHNGVDLRSVEENINEENKD